MSTGEQPLTQKDWFDKASRDWQKLEERLDEGEIEDAAFLLHQSIEAYLKGYVVSNEWELKHTHDVGDLLEEIAQRSPDYGTFKNLCKEVSEYYFLEWSPSPSKVPSRERVDDVVKQARELVGKIIEEVKP